MNAHPAEAAAHRFIKRMLTAPGTTSEHMLILADWMDEAAAATTDNAEAAIFTRRASELRTVLAPPMPAPAMQPAPALSGQPFTEAGR